MPGAGDPPAGDDPEPGGGRGSGGAADEEEAPPEPWVVDLVVRRQGELRLPLVVRLTFEDDTTRELVWSREDQAESNWLRDRFDSEVKLVSAVVDPERRYYLDTDMSNNQWYDETDGVTALRWAERVFTQYAHYLHRLGGIGG